MSSLVYASCDRVHSLTSIDRALKMDVYERELKETGCFSRFTTYITIRIYMSSYVLCSLCKTGNARYNQLSVFDYEIAF